MAEFTRKELTFLRDQLSREEVLAKKCGLYARQCEDPQLRAKCQQAAAKHQNHCRTLLEQLRGGDGETPTLPGTGFGDRERMEDLLASQRQMAAGYCVAAGDCASNELHCQFMTLLGEEQQLGMEFSQEMKKRGWHPSRQQTYRTREGSTDPDS